jgi:hypothetical protein
MIVFDLECRTGGHRFEGWFGSSVDFTSQQARGLVSCPQCHSADVLKAPMAPHLGRKGNQVNVPALAAAAKAEKADNTLPTVTVPNAITPTAGPGVVLPPEAAAMLQAYVRMQAEALKASCWVGEKFANDARAMHYGDKDHSPIHGQATAQEAHDLLEEGIEIAPILFPLVPPDHVN